MRRVVAGPIRATTTSIAVLVVALAVSLAAVLLVLLVRLRLEDSAVAVVVSRADDVATLVADGHLPKVLAFTGEDAALVQVVDGAGQVVAATPNIVGRPAITAIVPETDKPKRLTLRTLPVDRGERFAVIAQRADGPQGTYVVYTAISLDAADEGVHTLTLGLLGGVPLLVLLVGLVTWILTGNVLHPVEQIREEVDEITANRLHRRVPVPSSDDEVSRLARTMNDMLDRLESSADSQQRFVADASHELRSPLAAMRTTLEVNLAHPDRADWIATTNDLLVDHARVERIVQDLLTLARQGAAQQRPFAALNLSGIVESELLRRPRTRRPVDMEIEPSIAVMGDHDHLAQILRNLVENAERFASSRVLVRLHRDGDQAVLQVLDDGRGIAEANRQRVFERFARLDSDENRRHEGSGLGLAIVDELVRAHQGTVTCTELGGLTCFEVRLPVAGSGRLAS